MNRAIREAYDAAAAVFQRAGFACSLEDGSKHRIIVARRGTVTLRMPLPGTPSSGVEAGVKLAANSAKRRLRRLITGAET